MILTSTKDSVVISSSPAINAFVADPTKALKLTVYNNCTKLPEVNITRASIVNNTYTLLPATIGMSPIFTNGVYRVQLKYLGNTVVEDNGLFYISEGVDCKLVSLYASHIDCLHDKPCSENYMFWPYAFHKILQGITWCDDIVYEDACVVYNKMTELIDKGISCGCNE